LSLIISSTLNVSYCILLGLGYVKRCIQLNSSLFKKNGTVAQRLKEIQRNACRQ